MESMGLETLETKLFSSMVSAKFGNEDWYETL